MLSRLRYFVSDVLHWLSARRWRGVALIAAVLALAAAGLAGYRIADDDDDEEGSGPAPAPQVVVREVEEPEATDDLGFPAFATANTTRVAGPDPITDAAAVALAAFPSTGGISGPAAVSLVDAADWPSGIAAASLVAEPIGAPILITEGGEVPELTTSALGALAPSGSADTDDREAFRIGAAAEPEALTTEEVGGDNPAELAAAIDRLRARLAGEPDHVLLASSDDPAFAMPAAAWAARSGDPVLFVQRDSAPRPTRRSSSTRGPLSTCSAPSRLSPRTRWSR